IGRPSGPVVGSSSLVANSGMSSFTSTSSGTSAVRLPPEGITTVTGTSDMMQLLSCSTNRNPARAGVSLFEPDARLGTFLILLHAHALRVQQLARIHRKGAGVLLAIFAAPARRFGIPGEGRLGGVVVEILVLHHLADHEHQAVQRTAGRPPGRVHAHGAVEMIDIGMPHRRKPFHPRPTLWILIMQIDLHLMAVAELWRTRS